MSPTRIINCPACKGKLRVRSDAATVRCPKCSKTLNLRPADKPAPQATAQTASNPKPAGNTKPAGATSASGKKIKCPKCSVQLKIPASAVGRTVRCPKCSASLKIPASSVPGTPSGLAAASPAAPLDTPLNGLPDFGDGFDTGIGPLGNTGFPAPANPGVPSFDVAAPAGSFAAPSSSRAGVPAVSPYAPPNTVAAPRKTAAGGSVNPLLLIFGGSALAAFLLSVIPVVGFFVFIGILFCAMLAGTVGQVWVLVLAFQTDVVQGLLVWFVPFYNIYYMATNWEECKIPGSILIISTLVSISSLFGMFLGMIVFTLISGAAQG